MQGEKKIISNFFLLVKMTNEKLKKICENFFFFLSLSQSEKYFLENNCYINIYERIGPTYLYIS